MNKLTLLLFVAFMFSGCAHMRRTAVDYENHTVTICGNKWANQEDMESMAVKSCGGPVKIAKEYEQRSFSGYSGPYAVYKTNGCYVYKCGDV